MGIDQHNFHLNQIVEVEFFNEIIKMRVVQIGDEMTDDLRREHLNYPLHCEDDRVRVQHKEGGSFCISMQELNKYNQ